MGTEVLQVLISQCPDNKLYLEEGKKKGLKKKKKVWPGKNSEEKQSKWRLKTQKGTEK